MLALLLHPWIITIMVVIAASAGASSCFFRALNAKQISQIRAETVSLESSASSQEPGTGTQHPLRNKGWMAIGLACLLRAVVALVDGYIVHSYLVPSPTFSGTLNSLLSLAVAMATLLVSVGVFLIAQQTSATWSSLPPAPKNLQLAAGEYSYEQDILRNDVLQGDEEKRHSSMISLVIDVFIVSASVAALRWWLLVQPHIETPLNDSSLALNLNPTTFSTTPWVPTIAAFFHTVAVTGSIFSVILLAVIAPLWKNEFANEGKSARWARLSWGTMLTGAALFLFSDFRIFHHDRTLNFFDSTLQFVAPLLIGTAAFTSYCAQHNALLETTKTANADSTTSALPHTRVRRSLLSYFWRSPVTKSETGESSDSTSRQEHVKQRAGIRLWRKHSTSALFLKWRDALTIYGPCIALAAVAMRLSLWAWVLSPTVSATQTDVWFLPGGGANALHIWWMVALCVASGVRHVLLYRNEQETTRRLRDDVSQLSREVATRTRQLLSLHTVSSGLTNTLSRDQVISAALERMIEAARADAGVVWLRTDFDRNLLRTQDRTNQERQALDIQHTSGTVEIEYSNGSYSGVVAEEKTDSAPTNHAALLDGWRLVRSRGYEDEKANTVLEMMDQFLQRGGIPLCTRMCQQERALVGEVHLTPLKIDGQVIGLLGATRWKKTFEPIERRLMEAISSEVGVALRNAQLYQEANRRAELDSLTDLLSHRSVQEKMGAEISRARNEKQELTIVIMDLNNFKFFNDTYGHPIGDTVLKTVARCLRETCRPTDIIGRYGGDEFIALLPNTGAQNALKLCHKISERIERESFDNNDKDQRHIPIGLSFGAAIFPHDGANTLELLSAADSNLYESKRGGSPIHGLTRSAENAELRQLKDVGVGRSFGVLDALITAIDNKDHYTRRHSEDVTHWASLMARELDLPLETQRAVRISGILHDVGKIAVPDSILRKPGRLNDDEFNILQQHPVFGALIVKDVPNLPDVLGGIRHHHERFDGKGYPDRLAGEDIPLFGRLLAVPDCFSAMTTDRPYRKALTWSEAFTEIESGSGTQFDPQMVDAFLEVMARIVSEKNAAQPGDVAPTELPTSNLASSQEQRIAPVIPSTNSAIIADLVSSDRNHYADSSTPIATRKKVNGSRNLTTSTEDESSPVMLSP